MDSSVEFPRILEDATKTILELHKKGDKIPVQKQVAIALSGLISLTQQHDSNSIAYRDDLQFLSNVKAEYGDAAIALDERRCCSVLMPIVCQSTDSRPRTVASGYNRTWRCLLEHYKYFQNQSRLYLDRRSL